MKPYKLGFIVENDTEEIIVETLASRLLPPTVRFYTVPVGHKNGFRHAYITVDKFLKKEYKHIIVVYDADTTDPEIVKERKERYEQQYKYPEFEGYVTLCPAVSSIETWLLGNYMERPERYANPDQELAEILQVGKLTDTEIEHLAKTVNIELMKARSPSFKFFVETLQTVVPIEVSYRTLSTEKSEALMNQNTEKLRVAIVGAHRQVTGAPGSHNFATAFYAVPQTEVVGVFDLGAETRGEFVDCWRDVWGDVPTYDDYPKLLDEVKPDIVCVATRQTMHADQIERAVQAGVRGVMCDKPLATRLSEMDRIVAACEDVPLLFGLDRRWFERYRILRKLIAEGEIGAVTSVVAYGLANLINHGCHWYDTLLALAGDVEPAWVSGFVDDVSDQPPDSRGRLDPSGRAQIGLENGVVLYITADGRHPGAGLAMSFEVVGEKGRLFLLNDANDSFIWLAEGESKMRPIELPEETEPWPAGPAMVSDLVNAVQTGGRTSCDIDHARRATEIGFAIHVSSAKGGARVELPVAERSYQVESFPWGNE